MVFCITDSSVSVSSCATSLTPAAASRLLATSAAGLPLSRRPRKCGDREPGVDGEPHCIPLWTQLCIRENRFK